MAPYVVQFDGIHLKIRRKDGKSIRTTWDVIQNIKNEICGKDVTVIEVYPATDSVVNEANVRHFFVIQEGVIPKSLWGWH